MTTSCGLAAELHSASASSVVPIRGSKTSIAHVLPLRSLLDSICAYGCNVNTEQHKTYAKTQAKESHCYKLECKLDCSTPVLES